MSGQGEQAGQQRAGRWMIYAAWVVALALATWLFQGYLAGRDNPNRDLTARISGDTREVVLERNSSGHFVASGTINGEPVTFLLDTGATDVSVPAAVADRIGLERMARVTFQTANGTAPGYLTRIDRVSVGGITVRDVRGSINPNIDFDAVLLGMSYLGRIEFTQRNNQLILRQGGS